MEDEDMKYCKICLVTDCKMFISPSISEAYTQLVQVVLCDYKLYVCYECKNLLSKWQEFRSKCMMALKVLSSINIDHSKITKRIVRDIDRKHYKLESKLSRSCMLFVCNNSKPIVLPDPNLDSDIKTENDTNPDALEDEKFEISPEIDAKDFFSKVKKHDIEYPNEILKIEIETDTNPDLLEDDKPEINNFEINAGDPFSDLEKHGTEYPNEIFQSNHATDNIVPETKSKQKCLLNSKKNKSVPKEMRTLEHITKKRNSDMLPTSDMSDRKRRKHVSVTPSTNMMQAMHNYATIVVMTPSEAKKEMLLKKESRNYKTNPYTCELCYKGFTLRSTYDNHLKLHSPDSGTEECDICHILFRTSRELSKHIAGCHKYKITCKSCPYICFSLGQAKTHVAIHKGETCTCEQCGMSFRLVNSLANHKRKKHPDCACAYCGSMFGSLLGMKVHKQRAHKQDSDELLGPKCEECDVQFATETAWKRHLVLSSKHTVSNGCEDCGETFLTAKELRRHTKEHPPKQNSAHYAKVAKLYKRKFKAFDCKLCDKRLETIAEYEEHMKSEHPNFAEDDKQYICEVCGKVLKTYKFFKQHTNSHTGERPYGCEQCGKKYATPNGLLNHNTIHHSGAPQFKCDVCQKSFHLKYTLKSHMKVVHLGVRRFKCDICNKLFRHPCEVKAHKEYVHFKKPWPKRDRAKRRRNKKDKVAVE